MSVQTFPVMTEQTMRPELRIVRKADNIISVNVAEVCADNAEEMYYEDKLGCPRGVVLALGFQGALVVTAAVCWKLFLH